MTKNSCYTYFRITGDFDPDIVTEKLGLLPDKTWKIDDIRLDGSLHDFASWEFGRCDKYDIIVENQMHITIDSLLNKVDALNSIRDEFDVVFTLEIVPTIYTDSTSPCLAPSMKVIDFCHATRTEIDIDMYLMDTED